MSHVIQDSPLHVQTCVCHLVLLQSDAAPHCRALSGAKALGQSTIITLLEANTGSESCLKDLFASPSIIPNPKNLENDTFL